MKTPRECYELAGQYERQAATVTNERTRGLLLELAAEWRAMGARLKADTAPSSQPRSPESN